MVKSSSKKSVAKTVTLPAAWWQPQLQGPDLIILASILLPIATWFFASRLNPDGWMSRDPGVIITMAYGYTVTYWFVPLFALICAYVVHRILPGNLKNLLVTALLILSAIFSFFFYDSVLHAQKDEFAG